MTASHNKGEGSSGQLNSIIFIDTENTFRPERVQQIAEARGFDSEEIMKNVFVCKISNSAQLEALIRQLGKSIEEFKAKLVIVDSIISLHRAEYIGRETLADRQQRLNVMLHKLIRLSEIYNIAVVLTNQVQSSPDNSDSTRVDIVVMSTIDYNMAHKLGLSSNLKPADIHFSIKGLFHLKDKK